MSKIIYARKRIWSQIIFDSKFFGSLISHIYHFYSSAYLYIQLPVPKNINFTQTKLNFL